MPIFPIHQEAKIGATIPLPKKEARHLSEVFRVKVGDRVRVMDTAGERYEGSLVHEGKILAVTIEKKLPPLPDPYSIHLYLSLLKRDKIEWVVQKSVELNIEAVHLVTTERSVRQELSTTHLKRLSRIAEEAQKQCGRVRPLVIHAPIKITEVTLPPASSDALRASGNSAQFAPPLAGLPACSSPQGRGDKEGTHFFFHDCESRPLSTLTQQALMRFARQGTARSLPSALGQKFPCLLLSPQGRGRINLWIGPEGGWTPDEITWAHQNSFHFARLGPLTLRAETATLCAISSVTALYDLLVVGAPGPGGGLSVC